MPKHGGYRKLKSFQIAQLIHDITVKFSNAFIDFRSRTHSKMVQAARSGVHNIAEGSLASGTSRKTELKLTNVARASLEELRLDYEEYLRQGGLPRWPPGHPVLQRFRARRYMSVEDIGRWVKEEKERASANTSMQVHARPYSSTLVANAALSLLNLCCHLLDRQLAAQANAFEKEGGFTERLCRLSRSAGDGMS
jgi:four helix bundle suffix protein